MPVPDPTRRRILVVDDDKAILELVSTRLTLAGYDVFNARDGAEALSRIVNLEPHAVVLDLNMPTLDGFGVLETLGKEGAQAQPILVLTARSATADVRRAIALGARDYLAKPFKDTQLLSRVQRLFRAPLDRTETTDVLSQLDALIVGG